MHWVSSRDEQPFRPPVHAVPAVFQLHPITAVHADMVAWELQGMTVPLQVLPQVQPYSPEHAVCVPLALQGVTVPLQYVEVHEQP